MKKGFQFVLQTKYVSIFAEPKDCLGGVLGVGLPTPTGDDFYVFSWRLALRHKVPPAVPLPVGKAALSVKTTGVGRAGPFSLYNHRVL